MTLPRLRAVPCPAEQNRPGASVVSIRGVPLPHDPTRRGYCVVYHPGEPNRCPGCGRRAWEVGRVMAECAGCGCALPIDLGGRGG